MVSYITAQLIQLKVMKTCLIAVNVRLTYVYQKKWPLNDVCYQIMLLLMTEIYVCFSTHFILRKLKLDCAATLAEFEDD